VMREREALAENGLVIVNLTMSKSGQLIGKPEIISKGFVFVRDANEMFEAAQTEIAKVAAHVNGASLAGFEQALRERVQSTLSDFFYSETKRRPMIFALVNEA